MEHTEHSHDPENRYLETFKKFESASTKENISTIVKSMLDRHFIVNYTSDVLKKIHGFIDLTSLSSTDTKEGIWDMIEEKVNSFDGTRPDIPNVAAICTYPLFVDTVKQSLRADGVKIASVSGGFPSSQTFLEIKIAETSMAISDGAEEIDIVMNLGYFAEEDYELLCDEISEIKDTCRGAHLKVILETGALDDLEKIRKASILALYSGADFIKTSTGKNYPGASPEAVYVMCKVIKKYYELTNRKVGIKVSGGVRTPEESVVYYTIIKELLGDEWLSKDYFRIGASKLVDELIWKINELENP
jgi:deoxyribose-phosphate aldolase